MGLKKSLSSLIFVDHDKKDEKPKEKFVSKFPDANTVSFPTATPMMEGSAATMAPPVPTMNVPLECAPHMESIMKLYETGFSGLNQPGVEFYEFFEAIVEAGINDPSAYKMALKILAKSEKSMTKDSLVAQSQFYINELTKVYSMYSAEGAKKKAELTADKNAEGNKLKSDIQLLKDQMDSIKNQLSAKEMQLNQIDARYQPKINDYDCKMLANDQAKDRILGTIVAVVNGIKSNL